MLHAVIILILVSVTQALSNFGYPPSPVRPPWWSGGRGYEYTPYGRPARPARPARPQCLKRFDYNPVLLNWDSARLSCLAKGGLLASVTTTYESANFRSRYSSVLKKEAWLGGSERDRKGFWQWDHGRKPKQPMYFTNWARREPKWGKPFTAYCLLLVKEAQWEAADCSLLKPSICEYTVCSGNLVSDENDGDDDPKHLDPLIPTVKDDSVNKVNINDRREYHPVKPVISTDSNVHPKNDVDLKSDEYINDNDATHDRGEYDPVVISAVSPNVANSTDNEVNSTKIVSTETVSTSTDNSNTDSAASSSNATSDVMQKENGDDDCDGEADDGNDEGDSKDKAESDEDETGIQEREQKQEIERKAHLKLLSLLLHHVAELQKTKRPCSAPPSTDGVWNCNKDTFPWICILDCDIGRVAGDGIVNAKSGIPEGDGVIVCHDGLWSRDDFYCVSPPREAVPLIVDEVIDPVDGIRDFPSPE